MRRIVPLQLPVRQAYLLVVAAVSASACFAITDDIAGVHGPTTSDRDSSRNEDLDMHFTNFASHRNKYFEYWIVDRLNVRLSRGIIDVLTSDDFTISAPQAIPKDRVGAPYRLDFWVDNVVGTARVLHHMGASQDPGFVAVVVDSKAGAGHLPITALDQHHRVGGLVWLAHGVSRLLAIPDWVSALT